MTDTTTKTIETMDRAELIAALREARDAGRNAEWGTYSRALYDRDYARCGAHCIEDRVEGGRVVARRVCDHAR
jgi:hypothetical protein